MMQLKMGGTKERAKERERRGNYKEKKREKKDVYLICIKLHINERHPLVCIAVMLQNPVHGLRDIFHYQIQKKLIFTCSRKETMFQGNHIWVIHQTH